ncbi:MAG: hypothetical protein JWN50_197 [Parcubacteria group bacterium]|nr:hypothetical protein [Parcubacteria group bacterium]
MRTAVEERENLFGNSWGKQIMLELGFVASIGIAVAYTAIAVPVGLGQAVFQDGFQWDNAWRQAGRVWGAIFGHMKYLFRYTFSPAFRKLVRSSRRAMRERAELVSSNLRGFKDAVGELDYIDAGVLFVLLYDGIFIGWMVWLVALGFAGMIGSWGYRHYYTVAVPTHAPEVQTKIVYQPQVADQQEADFGPWSKAGEVSERVSDPNFKNTAIFSDVGSAKYSQIHVADRAKFAPLDNSELILNPRTEGSQIFFDDQHGNHFRVNPYQAFMFESDDYRVFMFDEKANILAVKTTNLKRNEK